jgi:Tol biopolymer transport system component
MNNSKMRRMAAPLTAILAIVPLFAQAPTPHNPPPAKERKTESFLERVLRVSGISASPTTLKGPGDEVQSGQIWLIELGSGNKQSLTAEGRYRSPVFAPEGKSIYALRGTDLVRLSGGAPQKLSSIKGISKLVGFSEDDADKVLILVADDAGKWIVELLSVSTGKVEVIPYASDSGADLQMLEHLRSWDRTYGDKTVYVKRQSKSSLSGPVEWTDVFLKQGASAPVNISACDQLNCGQPSLSPDGKRLLFVEAEP